jgi:uncharacterized protein (TIGR02145 family)
MRSILKLTFILLALMTTLVIDSCKKEENVPVVSTSEITNILGTSANAGGTITNEGTGTVLFRGVCWSTGTKPTLADSKTIDGAGAGTFLSNITDLNGATIYYVRAYATNNVGTGYGMTMSFTTMGEAPIPTISTATNIDTSSATLNCLVNPNYLSTVAIFEYGVTTTYGSIDTATQSPITGSENTNVSATVSGLTPGTTYHYRLKATNSLGDSNSDDITFTTLGQVPLATALTASNVASSGATLNGTVNANYLATVITFEYGTSTSYGSSAVASQSPASGNGIRNVSASITGLTGETIYHYRICAVNSLGTTYSDDITFTTNATGVTDIEGNIYNIVVIGSQVWMAENLKTTKYRNNDPITNITNTAAWASLTTEAYCWYDNNITNKTTYGALYNYYSVVDSRNLCPTGWHVPTDSEWKILEMNLGMTNAQADVEGIRGTDQGTRLKSIKGWNSEGNGSNTSGFSALPGGYRDGNGTFSYVGDYGDLWSSTEFNTSYTWYRYLYYNDGFVYRYYNSKRNGFSVRCLRD